MKLPPKLSQEVICFIGLVIMVVIGLVVIFSLYLMFIGKINSGYGIAITIAALLIIYIICLAKYNVLVSDIRKGDISLSREQIDWFLDNNPMILVEPWTDNIKRYFAKCVLGFNVYHFGGFVPITVSVDEGEIKVTRTAYGDRIYDIRHKELIIADLDRARRTAYNLAMETSREILQARRDHLSR